MCKKNLTNVTRYFHFNLRLMLVFERNYNRSTPAVRANVSEEHSFVGDSKQRRHNFNQYSLHSVDSQNGF